MIVQGKNLVSLVFSLDEIIELRDGLSALWNHDYLSGIGFKLKDDLDALIQELKPNQESEA